jgi:hypothetical protein
MGHDKTQLDLEAGRETLFAGTLRKVRSTALAAALVPVALVAAQPATAYAQTVCNPSSGCSVPEPSTLLLMAPAAALLWRRHRRGGK